MEFDYVNDIQKAFRKVLDCNARPGKIHSLKEECSKLELPLKINKATLLLMLMLLDNEVTFHVAGNNAQEVAAYMHKLTYGGVTSLEEADFVFVLEDAARDRLPFLMERCRRGSLLDPHLSTTVIVEVPGLTGKKNLLLKGPGIKEEIYLSVGINDSWVEKRDEVNKEYPLGIDIYFLDGAFNVTAIPRTTSISKMR